MQYKNNKNVLHLEFTYLIEQLSAMSKGQGHLLLILEKDHFKNKVLFRSAFHQDTNIFINYLLWEISSPMLMNFMISSRDSLHELLHLTKGK